MFTEFDEFAEWLSKQPQRLRILLVARALLRAFPSVIVETEAGGLQAGPFDSRVLSYAYVGLIASVYAVTGDPMVRAAAVDVVDDDSFSSTIREFHGWDLIVEVATPMDRSKFSDNSLNYMIFGPVGALVAEEISGREEARNGDGVDVHDIVEGIQSALFGAVLKDSDISLPELAMSELYLDNNNYSDLEDVLLFNFPPKFVRDGRYAFFRNWYSSAILGRPLDWEFQRRVALIPKQIWRSGIDAVAEAITEIEAAFLAEKAPLAEQVSYNPETGRFFAEPIPMQNAAFMAALMARTADALDDALHGNNGLREDMREVRVLRRTHERYANDPQRVEMDYVSVAVSLRRNFESKELADSEDNLALLDAVEEGARGIRAHHPEVAANRESLARQALRELPAEAIALLEDAAETLPEISEGVMKEDFERDIPKLINDALTPLPNGAPPLPGMDEANRLFSRVAKTRLKIADATKAGARIGDSNEFKTVRLAKEVFTLLSALVRLGLQLFGIL